MGLEGSEFSLGLTLSEHSSGSLVRTLGNSQTKARGGQSCPEEDEHPSDALQRRGKGQLDSTGH